MTMSMINIEISLNRWLDFYPGYMYVHTADIDKARAEGPPRKGGARKGRLLILGGHDRKPGRCHSAAGPSCQPG